MAIYNSIRKPVSTLLFVLGFLGFTVPGWPQAAATTSLDGVIASLDSGAITMTTNGKAKIVTIAADTPVLGREAATVQDIKAGDALAVTAHRGDNGGLVASVINIFTPEVYQNVRKGQFPMQQPGQIMTNALVTQYVQSVEGRLLHMKLDNDETTITVPDGIPVTRFVSLKLSDLKPGHHVTIRGTAGSDGSFKATSINLVSSYMAVTEQWSAVPIPSAPALKPVSIEAATTALLILDMQNQLSNPDTRKRSWATVPFIAKLLQSARAAKMLVVYSTTPTGTPADIVSALAPVAGDPIVKSSADKYFKTDLESILASRGIRTVIVTGTAANGAVLNTATGAALRGLKVIVPVDGMSNEDLYAEQYVAYHLLNSPGTRAAATLTRSDLIEFP